MITYISDTVMRVGDAPVGLLQLEPHGQLICKTEYKTNGSCDCFILSSGEAYHGEGDEAMCRAIILRNNC